MEDRFRDLVPLNVQLFCRIHNGHYFTIFRKSLLQMDWALLHWIYSQAECVYLLAGCACVSSLAA